MPAKIKSVSDEIDVVVGRYRKMRDDYKSFAKYIGDLVGSQCRKGLIHTTQFRAKTIESFERKCYKTNSDGKRRYRDPLSDITDLAGVRIIVFVKESVSTICSEIGKILNVREIEDGNCSRLV
jgi:putative GTP pyrophosphokinase